MVNSKLISLAVFGLAGVALGKQVKQPKGHVRASVPDEWTCDPEFFDNFDGCDCDCGAFDPDCLVMRPGDLVGCDRNQACNNEGECIDIPNSWTCNPRFYSTRDGCDCECGAPDPDCEVIDEVFGCEPGERCVRGNCV